MRCFFPHMLAAVFFHDLPAAACVALTSAMVWPQISGAPGPLTAKTSPANLSVKSLKGQRLAEVEGDELSRCTATVVSPAERVGAAPAMTRPATAVAIAHFVHPVLTRPLGPSERALQLIPASSAPSAETLFS